MPTPDPRSAGEAAEQRALERARFQLRGCVMALAMHGSSDERMKSLMDAEEIFERACKAEARAALLADAPAVWVVTDADGLTGSRVFTTEQFADQDGTFWPDEDCAFLDTALTPPGTCVRYRLVPDPEEAP